MKNKSESLKSTFDNAYTRYHVYILAIHPSLRACSWCGLVVKDPARTGDKF